MLYSCRSRLNYWLIMSYFSAPLVPIVLERQDESQPWVSSINFKFFKNILFPILFVCCVGFPSAGRLWLPTSPFSKESQHQHTSSLEAQPGWCDHRRAGYWREPAVASGVPWSDQERRPAGTANGQKVTTVLILIFSSYLAWNWLAIWLGVSTMCLKPRVRLLNLPRLALIRSCQRRMPTVDFREVFFLNSFLFRSFLFLMSGKSVASLQLLLFLFDDYSWDFWSLII